MTERHSQATETWASTHPVITEVTDRIASRSADTRRAYLDRMAAAAEDAPTRTRLPCSNLAHGFAASAGDDRSAIRAARRPGVAIVSAYNDLLSAHQPLREYPDWIKDASRSAGGVARFAGGVPAMCDGITQARPGMELSLFSREVIAMSTAIALSHEMFDGALLLGVCDKIVPGLLIGALSFGHLPAILVPAGPMSSGLANAEKAHVRQRYTEGRATREELLDAESASYHSAGTCTFYGTANSNQLVVEAMGLQLPGASFVPPGTPLRKALTEEAGRRVVTLARGEQYTPLAEVVDERAVVNGVVALLASGGSTNHTLHLVAIAAAAGIQLTWEDFAELSGVTPLLARVYPNGTADINHFHAAGGVQALLATLADAGLVHTDVRTVAGTGLQHYLREPVLRDGELTWRAAAGSSRDESVLRGVNAPFASEGGLRLLAGNLGRAVIKVSAVERQHRTVSAPARVFSTQEDFDTAFRAGELDRDVVVVIRGQGPSANGMPELHGMTPALSSLLDRGYRVALVTDGRMSGASGKVPAALHVSPEAAAGGALAKVADGDPLTLDGQAGTLEVLVDEATLAARPLTAPAPSATTGTGRELFSPFRRTVSPAHTGATVFAHGDGVFAGRAGVSSADAANTAPRPANTTGEVLGLAPVIPVVTLDDAERAVPLARALYAGGIGSVELTLRTPVALEAIKRVAAEVPEMVVGAGTVTAPEHALDAAAAGARFLVTPGSTERLLDAAESTGLPVLPGAGTVSEAMRLAERGYTALKFFPAEAGGGVDFLRSIAAPLPALRFCPTGGIDANRAGEYLALGNVPCVGGSWLTPKAALQRDDYAVVQQLAREACELGH